MPDFQPFVMERAMSLYEQTVAYNLSESGVHPVLLKDLLALAPGATERLFEIDLNYPHVNGTPELRAHIAALYHGAGPENVLVTVGAAEANYITTRTILSPGDEAIIMLPNYMQIWGIARNHGVDVKSFHLREERAWEADVDELDALVSDRTRMIAVCNPNNPTGHIMTAGEMDGIVAAAERCGAWILADEVYRGAERMEDQEAPSFYGRYDRVLAVGSLSKAYGTPGLRIGWVVAPQAAIDEIWTRHEYTAISTTMISNHLAAIALSPAVRPQLRRRTRTYIQNGYPMLEAWMNAHDNTFSLTPPQAAAIAFVRYNLDINSSEFADRLRREKSVLIVPGDHFGMDRLLRISFGLPHDYLAAALDRIHQLVQDIQKTG